METNEAVFEGAEKWVRRYAVYECKTGKLELYLPESTKCMRSLKVDLGSAVSKGCVGTVGLSGRKWRIHVDAWTRFDSVMSLEADLSGGIRCIDDLFERIDVDNDGELTRAEVLAAAKTLKLTPEKAEELFDKLDHDNSGTLNRDETGGLPTALQCTIEAEALVWVRVFNGEDPVDPLAALADARRIAAEAAEKAKKEKAAALEAMVQAFNEREYNDSMPAAAETMDAKHAATQAIIRKQDAERARREVAAAISKGQEEAHAWAVQKETALAAARQVQEERASAAAARAEAERKRIASQQAQKEHTERLAQLRALRDAQDAAKAKEQAEIAAFDEAHATEVERVRREVVRTVATAVHSGIVDPGVAADLAATAETSVSGARGLLRRIRHKLGEIFYIEGQEVLAAEHGEWERAVAKLATVIPPNWLSDSTEVYDVQFIESQRVVEMLPASELRPSYVDPADSKLDSVGEEHEIGNGSTASIPGAYGISVEEKMERGPPSKLSSSSTIDYNAHLGGRVRWMKYDKDVPFSTVGRIQGVSHLSDEVFVAFPRGTWAFPLDELELVDENEVESDDEEAEEAARDFLGYLRRQCGGNFFLEGDEIQARDIKFSDGEWKNAVITAAVLEGDGNERFDVQFLREQGEERVLRGVTSDSLRRRLLDSDRSSQNKSLSYIPEETDADIFLESIEFSAAELKHIFEARAVLESSEHEEFGLSQSSFEELIADLLEGNDIARKPAKRDLAEAFRLADEDQSGIIDVFEFIRIWHLIQSGEVAGLGIRAMDRLVPQRSSAIQEKRVEFTRRLRGAGDTCAPGDKVLWKEASASVPEGTVGQVLALYENGGVEVVFINSPQGQSTTLTLTANDLEHENIEFSAEELRNAFISRAQSPVGIDGEPNKCEELTLSQSEFEALIVELLEAIGAARPSSEDMRASFALADEDECGRIDMFEFIQIWSLIRQGKVQGLGVPPRRGLQRYIPFLAPLAEAQLNLQVQFRRSLRGNDQSIRPGDYVTWHGADADLPSGTVGHVLRVHDDDDDIEVFFSMAEGPAQTFTFEKTSLSLVKER